LRTVFSAGPCISLLKSSIIEGDNPVYDMDYQCIMIQSLRVELFGMNCKISFTNDVKYKKKLLGKINNCMLRATLKDN